MICSGCGNENARRVRIVYDEDDRIETCEDCGRLTSLYYPDVYFPGEPYMDPNLVRPTDVHSPDGILVRSKRHKAALLREQGLVERGDRVHGAINYDPKMRH